MQKSSQRRSRSNHQDPNEVLNIGLTTNQTASQLPGILTFGNFASIFFRHVVHTSVSKPMNAKFPDTVSYALLVQALINRTNQPTFKANPEFKQTLRELLIHHWSVCPPDTDEASGLYEILLQDFNNTNSDGQRFYE